MAGSSGSGSIPGLDAPFSRILSSVVEQVAVSTVVPGSIPGGSGGFLFSHIIFLLGKGSCFGGGFSFYQHVVDNAWIDTRYWNGGEPEYGRTWWK